MESLQLLSRTELRDAVVNYLIKRGYSNLAIDVHERSEVLKLADDGSLIVTFRTSGDPPV
tara:strand:- start:362 stop:541 length:180 start_codon:yes stop_codon:yes gene_type:complete